MVGICTMMTFLITTTMSNTEVYMRRDQERENTPHVIGYQIYVYHKAKNVVVMKTQISMKESY